MADTADDSLNTRTSTSRIHTVREVTTPAGCLMDSALRTGHSKRIVRVLACTNGLRTHYQRTADSGTQPTKLAQPMVSRTKRVKSTEHLMY